MIGGSECQTNPNTVEYLNFREIKFLCISCNIAVVPWDEMIYPKQCGCVLNSSNQFLKDIYTTKKMRYLYGIRDHAVTTWFCWIAILFYLEVYNIIFLKARYKELVQNIPIHNNSYSFEIVFSFYSI